MLSLENESVTRETTTNKKGNWAIPGLQNGPWRVTVRAEGYAPVAKTAQVSEINRNPQVEIVLKKIKKAAMVGEAPGLEFFEEGNQQFKQKNYEQALENYNKFLEKNPQHPESRIGQKRPRIHPKNQIMDFSQLS